MGKLSDEFDQTLEGWRELYRDEPETELQRLLLLALEREQLVTVAYRTDLMVRRLSELPLPEQTRRVLQQGLAWAWKDEEMHAIYTRGLLLGWGSTWVRLIVWVQQWAGSVGGWSSSVTQHARWRDAPMSRAIAEAVSFVGRLAGRVPRGVRGELRFLTFREFCLLQMDAEYTAAACWRRLAQLSETIPAIDAETRSAFTQMWKDEESHRRLFQIAAAALDESVSTQTPTPALPQRLVEELREVNEFFVPREYRTVAGREHPLGRGGIVDVFEGDSGQDATGAMSRLLDNGQLESAVREKAEKLGRPISEMSVVIKTTFMMGYDKRDRSGIVDPMLVDLLARFLTRLGCRKVVVGDGRNIYDQYCENRSVERVAGYFGFVSEHYEVLDMTADQVEHSYPRGLGQSSVSRCWRDSELRISFSKLRSHPVDFTHLCIGAMQGIGARLEDFLFVERQAHRDTALLMPLTEFPPDFALIEGYDCAADGLVGIIACPKAPGPRRLYAGADALAVDMVATRHLGLDNPRDSLLLDAACLWFGDPSSRTRVHGVDTPVHPWRSPYHNEVATLLSIVANPVYQFASHRGAAFVPPMDTDAFPLRSRGSVALRAQRWLMRKVLGMELR